MHTLKLLGSVHSCSTRTGVTCGHPPAPGAHKTTELGFQDLVLRVDSTREHKLRSCSEALKTV